MNNSAGKRDEHHNTLRLAGEGVRAAAAAGREERGVGGWREWVWNERESERERVCV